MRAAMPVLALFLLTFAGCPVSPEGNENNNNGNSTNAFCGNNVAEAGEDCDGTDLAGESCESLGLSGGTLNCLSCQYDTSGCSGCGNGTCDQDETREDCPEDCGARSIATGYGHTCASFGDGSAWCWGDNYWGELGIGSNVDSPTPALVSSLSGVQRMCAGADHSCALLIDGSAWCWGYNSSGGLGDGTQVSSSIPVPVIGLSDVIFLSCGWNHTCAIMADSQAFCWGYNYDGQVGSGSEEIDVLEPESVDLIGVTSISTGAYYSCASIEDGTIWCWGTNEYGNLGNGQPTSTSSPYPVQVSTEIDALSLSATSVSSTTCAITDDQTLICWGANHTGSIGDGTYDNIRTTPVTITELSGVAFATVGAVHSCAATVNGQPFCWGGLNTQYNQGQLGNGSFSGSSTPQPIINLVDVVVIKGGFNHSCAITSDGSVWCWGDNSHGELGVGNHVSSSTTPLLLTFP
ncbi:RCC1 domain-containing protein [Myxococcota bacterium]